MSSTQPQASNPALQTHTEHETVVVKITDPLSHPTAPHVRTALVDLLNDKPRKLLIDLSDITTLDTIGIGALAATSLWARQKGVDFAILPSPIVCGVLTAAKLDRYLSLTESV